MWDCVCIRDKHAPGRGISTHRSPEARATLALLEKSVL